METPEQIEARLRADYPQIRVHEDGVDRVLSEAEYEARIAAWVVAEVARAQRAATTDAERADRELLRARYDALKAGTASAAQVQDTLARLLRHCLRESE
jgi:hypothetical protein